MEKTHEVRSTGEKIARVLIWVVLFVIAALTIFPVLYVIFGSLKENKELLKGGSAIFPQGVWAWSNYAKAWQQANFARYTANSLFISFGVMIISLINSSMAGYSFARRPTKFKEALYLVFVGFMFINVGSVSLRPLYELAVGVKMNTSLISVILISAGGATLEQYYGVNRYLGSSIMAALVLAAYLLGFEKLVDLVSPIGPVIIAFSIFVGIFTLVRDLGNFSEIGNYTAALSQFHAAPHWSISAALYLSLNFLCGSTYYTALGASADSYKSVKWGAILGALALVATIAVMNLAIILNAGELEALSVPTLYLASKISGVIGTVFSVVLVLGIFTSSTTTVWSFCSGFFKDEPKKNRLFSVFAVAACTALGFVPFGRLMAVAYPAIGYVGLYFIACVIRKGIRKK